MRLDQISDSDLVDLQRLSRELLDVMYRAKMHDAILADLLDEFEQQANNLRRARFADSASSRSSSGGVHSHAATRT